VAAVWRGQPYVQSLSIRRDYRQETGQAHQNPRHSACGVPRTDSIQAMQLAPPIGSNSSSTVYENCQDKRWSRPIA
ncbi:MAG TPA: hypothetical protein VN828_18895, partial [Acidobacteriaceae bacterium]|nr:hypothetical protein [Acidobacteriaceae bacterium]